MTATITNPSYQIGSNADIAHLQQWLAHQGLYHGPVNGQYNPTFQNSLSAWQRTQGLVATGNVDFQTLNHVSAQVNALSGGGVHIDPAVRKSVSDTYGPGMVAYLGNAELAPIIVQAAKERAPDTILHGRLSQTSYWKHTQDTARAWDTLQATDPASAKAQLDSARLMVQQQAQSLGLALNSIQLNELSENAIRMDWINPSNRSLLTNIMVNTLVANPKVMRTGGSFATAMDQVKATGTNYLIKSNDTTNANLAAKVVQGTMQQKDIDDYFGRIAKVRHPGLAHVIDSGVDLHTFLDPYRQDIGKELDVSPDSVDFLNDPRWSRLLDWNPDGKGPRMATTAEALQVARSQPEWWSTTNGRASGASLGLTLARGMGLNV